MSRAYPDESVAAFEAPPRAFTDGEDREIEIVGLDRADGGERVPEDTVAALARMYDRFDPADRAQGIPPGEASAVREWLDAILEDGQDVIARHDGECVGHATLVGDGSGDFELAIFVLSAYQHAGIGSVLLESLLGLAQKEDIERVWLTVERWNGAATALYHKVGFETCNTESFELEMSIRLQ